MKTAVYAKDMNDEKFADLRAWVLSKGTTDIIEYRDTTPLRGRSGDKEFKRLLQDAEKRMFGILYIDKLDQIVDYFRPGALLYIFHLRSKGVRLISRTEDWTDLSPKDLIIIYLAYCQHTDSEEYEMPIKARSGRSRAKKRHSTIDDHEPGNA